MVSRIAAWRRRLAGGALALLIAGCAQLPVGVARPVTQALPTPDGTPLAALVQQRREAAIRNAAGRGNASGFMLLPSPELAYDSRLALIEGATRTLDLQYYAIHADRSTTRLADGLRAAAARGVRVRILIDDFHSTGRDAQVLALALEPGIDIRLFNPLAGGRTSTLARALGSIDDASRIQQRMHNKLFIADNVLGVTGGRNLGDAYFGKGKKDNFVDLDVLAAGPIVQDMSRSFDRYWNNERAYPVQSLLTRAELESLRDDAVRDATAAKDAADPAAPDTARDRLPLDLKQAAFVWAPAVLLVDQPAKIAADTPGASSAPGLVVTRRAALGNASEAAAEGDTVVEGLLQLVGQAQRELLIISPYFVPGPDIKRAFAALTARGVRVRVLTNSLASNDAPIAHVGYARHRDELLAMGVQLYEMRGEGASLRSALGRSGGGGSTGDSRAMLHSKVLVMDQRLLAVGSMNLDLRSQLQNTEVALLIRSSELSGAATDVIETTLREAAWHVERVDGQLTWRAPEGSGLKNTTTEPDASATLQLVLKLLGPLAPDSML